MRDKIIIDRYETRGLVCIATGFGTIVAGVVASGDGWVSSVAVDSRSVGF